MTIIKDIVSEIGQEENWPEDDVIVVIHVKRRALPALVMALEGLGIRDSVGIAPEREA